MRAADGAERVDVLVEGRVQGVGFRDFCVRSAERIGLVGYAANLRDGRVRVVAEGPRKTLETFVREVQHGPRLARVDRSSVTWHAATAEFRHFRIHHDDEGA